MYSGALSPARSSEAAGSAFGSRSNFVLSKAGEGKFGWIYEFSWSWRLQPSAFGNRGYNSAARRISHLVHAVSGGDHAGYAAGDFRISNADVPVDGSRSSKRVDVRRFD